MPSMRFSSAASKAVKVAKAEGKAASTSEGVLACPGLCMVLCRGLLTTANTAVWPLVHLRHAWQHARAQHTLTQYLPDNPSRHSPNPGMRLVRS